MCILASATPSDGSVLLRRAPLPDGRGKSLEKHVSKAQLIISILLSKGHIYFRPKNRRSAHQKDKKQKQDQFYSGKKMKNGRR